MSETFLYLTTTGRKTGEPRNIEIWYVEHEGPYYMVAEGRERAHWVQNIAHTPQVTFSVGTREDREQVLPRTAAMGRALDRAAEPELSAAVAALMNAKYNWSDGLIVQLTPTA